MHRLLAALSLFAAACSSDAELPSEGKQPSEGRPDAGDTPVPDAGGPSCTAALDALLTPKDAVSSGDVAVLSDEDGVRTLYVDASAGGTMAAAENPRLYLDLAAARRVDVTDLAARESTEWDLALKRPVLFSNGGDGGPGSGGAVFVETGFDAVTRTDAEALSIPAESFVDGECAPKLDATNAVRTSFDGWYAYDTANNTLAPTPGTWIVKGGRGALFKLEILSYYATPEGDTGGASGHYTLRVGAL